MVEDSCSHGNGRFQTEPSVHPTSYYICPRKFLGTTFFVTLRNVIGLQGFVIFCVGQNLVFFHEAGAVPFERFCNSSLFLCKGIYILCIKTLQRLTIPDFSVQGLYSTLRRCSV